MSRRIILNLAVSLDGYIADENGGFDWIEGDGDHNLDTLPKWEHTEFLKTIDTVVMGKTSYEQGFAKDFDDKLVLVATNDSMQDYANIRFIQGDLCARIAEENPAKGGDIYLFGGGKLCDEFIKADVVDEYIIGIIPIILGKGIPMFLKENPAIKLTLKEQYIEEGVVILRYEKRG